MNVSFDYFHNLEDVELYLCNPDERPLFSIDAVNRNVVLRFNDLSELTFDYYPTATDYDGNNVDLGGYDMLQTRRLVYATKIGWFVIKDVVEHDDGKIPYKTVSCNSLQTRFNDKGIVSEERIYYFYNPSNPLDDGYDDTDPSQIPSVVGQLNKQLGVQLDLAQGRLTPQNPYDDWTITYISSSLYNCARTFDDNTHTAYEWMIGTVGDAYEACFLFDFMNKAIQVVLPSELTEKANVLFSFGNFMKDIEISEESDNLVTVLDVTGNNCDITNVNPTGTNYICNFDYYMDSVEHKWMSDDLISILSNWKTNYNSNKGTYKTLVQQLRALNVKLTESTDNLQYYSIKLTDLKNARDKKIVANASNETVDPNTSTLYGIISAETIEENNVWDEKWEVGYISTGSGKDQDSNNQCRSIGYTNVTPGETLTVNIGSGSQVTLYYYTSTKTYFQYTSVTSSSNITVPTGAYFMRLTYNNINYYKFDVCISRPADNMGGDKSLCPNSSYYSTNFNRYTTVTAYENPPAFDLTARTWSFSGQTGYSGTVTEHVSAATPRLYFMDVTSGAQANKSYSKLTPKEAIYTDRQNNNTTRTYRFCKGFERFAAYDELPYWIDKFEEFVNTRNGNISTIQGQIESKQAELSAISSTTNIINYILNNGGASASALIKELYCYWIEGSYNNDNICVEDGTPFEGELDLEDELMQSGETELARVSQPKLSFSLGAVDYLSQYEFREQAEALELGKIITVERKEGVWYYPFLLEISMNLDNREEFGLKFANALKLTDWNFTYAELLFDASNVTRQVGANWQNLMQYTNDRPEIGSLVRDPLSATLRAAFANMKNQKFTTDDTGILGRKENESSPGTYDDKQVRLLNNVLLFTDDNWKTVKTALGEITDGQNTTYGLVAETIIGSLILGNTLNITNGASSVTLNQSGITIMNNSTTPASVVFSADTSGNVVISGASGWVTEEELEDALATKNRTFYQTTAPDSSSGRITGDLWIDTDDGNKLYRFSGGTWVPVTDARITSSTKDVQTVYYLSINPNDIPTDGPVDSNNDPYWVTNSTGNASVWTTKIPTPRQNDPAHNMYATYYSCTQTRSQDQNTITNTSVIELSTDNTILDWCATESNTTVINGGMIATNSIYANSIKANEMVTRFLTVKDASDNVIFEVDTEDSRPSYQSVHIGGFRISSSAIFSGNSIGSANCFLCSSPLGEYKTIAGHSSNTWQFKVGSYFGVESDGSLWCTNGHFSGTLEATRIMVTKDVTIGGTTYTYTLFDVNQTASTPYVEISGLNLGLSTKTGRKSIRCMYTNGRTKIDEMDYTGLYIGEDGISIRGPAGSGDTDSYILLDVLTGAFNFKGNLVATTGEFKGQLSAAWGTFGTGSSYKWNIGSGSTLSSTSSIWLTNSSGYTDFAGIGGIGASGGSCIYLGGDGFSMWYPNAYTDYCTSLRPGAFMVQALDVDNFYNGVTMTWDGMGFYANATSAIYGTLPTSSSRKAMILKIESNTNHNQCWVRITNGLLQASGHIEVSSDDIVTTSDLRAKNTISDISDEYDVLFNELKPSTFKYNNGTSGRLHVGMIAQDVYDAIGTSGLTTQDFAGYVDVYLEGEKLGLRYEEFISLNTWQIQKLKRRVTALEARIAELEAAVGITTETQYIDEPEPQSEPNVPTEAAETAQETE